MPMKTQAPIPNGSMLFTDQYVTYDSRIGCRFSL